MTEKIIMGNEAIALGAIAAGVKVVSGYPGTPSTEIVEALLNEAWHEAETDVSRILFE